MLERSYEEYEPEKVPDLAPLRLSPGTDLSFLKAMQSTPCPWGDLRGGTVRFSYVPTALEVGSGKRMYEARYNGLVHIGRIGQMIYSDIFDANKMRPNYAEIDLTDPKTIHLGGNKVHAIFSSFVFTHDGFGVNFYNPEDEINCAKALVEMLMPGGIMYHDNFCSDRFSNILKTFGLFEIGEIRHIGESLLQKPF